MPEDVFSDPTIIRRDINNLQSNQKPTIRILLYTDDPQLVVRQIGPPLGLGAMISHLQTHALAFANLSITLRNRYPGFTASSVRKIHTIIQEEEGTEPFDQIWFFGLHQINKSDFHLGIGGGGPDSELDKDEEQLLRSRMDGGLGVLVTGDHANRRPPDAEDNPESPRKDETRNANFLGLGRALGRCIPRAGQMRDWEGKPTANPRYSINSQVVTFGADIDRETRFQEDAIGQQLILQTFNDAGRPSRQGHPHPLFLYRQGRAIQLFPDHLHEGAATVPKDLDSDWGTVDGVQPKPGVVAYGLDKRNGKKFKLMAVYDGDPIGAGRIVADSTWHHYFNENLFRFPAESRVGTAADQIGQYYSNLALWLTPRHKRIIMADTMLRWLAQHPLIAELAGPIPSQHVDTMVNTGGLAKQVLAEVASDCEIHELLQMLVLDANTKRRHPLYFPDGRFTLSPLPSKQLLLGSLIHGCPTGSPVALSMETSNEAVLMARRSAFASASQIAFKKQRLRVAGTARLAKKLFDS